MNSYIIPTDEVPLHIALVVANAVISLVCLLISGSEVVAQLRSHFQSGSAAEHPNHDSVKRRRSRRRSSRVGFDYVPYLMAVTSASSVALAATNVHSLFEPSFPVILDYYPVTAYVGLVQPSIAGGASNLIVMRRVQSVCLKRTSLLYRIIAPVTITFAVIMIPVNMTVGYYHVEEVGRAGGPWATYDIGHALLLLNALQGIWGIGCNIVAYFFAFYTPSAERREPRDSRGISSRVTDTVASLSFVRSVSTTSSSTPALPKLPPRKEEKTQHLLSSVKQTYKTLTLSYVVCWTLAMALFGAAGAYMSIGPRWSLTSIVACAGSLHEMQFRRIIRSRVKKQKRIDKRAVMHFEDTVAGTVSVAPPKYAAEGAVVVQNTGGMDATEDDEVEIHEVQLP
ncbi:hypothetical protein H9P43_006632 [Blastocladiella emersonii ATCC 22665]|nr:hypothetical protein H9P43_006632 [Blastocladiella emersonii ATCC 22665]